MSVLTVALVGGMVSTVYFELVFDELQFGRFGLYTDLDMVFGSILLVAVLIATHRSFGNIISFMVILSMIYAIFGPVFPGVLNHGGASLSTYIPVLTLEFTGVYHMIVQIAATWIFIFLLWAGIIEEMGFLDVLYDVGFLIGSVMKSGIAQTAVVASMLMGSITGSPMANIAVTGSFTIPLMKDRGLEPRIAGAIESLASTGGMILPPVMGSVAFIMSNFLGIPYGDIVISAALPALLFYGATFISIHIIVVNKDIDLTVEREVDPSRMIYKSIPMLVSLAALVYFLVVLKYPPGISGVYAIFMLVGTQLAMVAVIAQDKVAELREVVEHTIKGLVTGSTRMVSLTMVMLGMGVIITSIAFTAVGYRLSLEIVSITSGNVFFLLGLVMVSSIILGMGMPTVAAYLVTVTLIAPAMVQFGFAEITAHFFVFYYAMIAAITPPIALSPAVASQIADSDFVETAISTMKMGIPLFILPFIFALNQELIVYNGVSSLATFVKTLFGFTLLVFGLHYTDFNVSQVKTIGVRSLVGMTGLLVLFYGTAI